MSGYWKSIQNPNVLLQRSNEHRKHKILNAIQFAIASVSEISVSQKEYIQDLLDESYEVLIK
jgi:hypothetical protein